MIECSSTVIIVLNLEFVNIHTFYGSISNKNMHNWQSSFGKLQSNLYKLLYVHGELTLMTIHNYVNWSLVSHKFFRLYTSKMFRYQKFMQTCNIVHRFTISIVHYNASMHAYSSYKQCFVSLWYSANCIDTYTLFTFHCTYI